MLVGLATGVKLTPGIFIVWFLLTRQWRTFWTAIASAFATIAIGAIALPHSSWTYWTDTFFHSSRVGDSRFAGNQSLNGAIWRAIGPDGSTTLWLVAVAIVSMIALHATLRLYRDKHHSLSVLTAAFWGLLISPISWEHHWIWQFPALLTFAFFLSDTYRSATPTRESASRLLSFGAWVLIAAWLAASWTNAIRVFANGYGNEYTLNAFEQFIANTYVVLGCASLCWLAAFARASRKWSTRCKHISTHSQLT